MNDNGGPERDFAAEIDSVVRAIQSAPDDLAARERLGELAGEWLRAEGLTGPTEAESVTRTTLAGWLGHLGGEGTVVHLGWREGSVAAALGALGATVVSYLDHPARAMVAALEHGTERVAFGVLGQIETSPGGADLVVVETAGVRPVVELAHARRLVRPEGWLAILGMPQLPELPATVDAGCFRADASGSVLPCRPGDAAEMITLLRSTAAPQVSASWLRDAQPAFHRRPDRPADPAVTVDEFKRKIARILDRTSL